MASDAVEDALKTIYSLQQGVWTPVRTSIIAEVASIVMSIPDHDDDRDQLTGRAGRTRMFAEGTDGTPAEVTES